MQTRSYFYQRFLRYAKRTNFRTNMQWPRGTKNQWIKESNKVIRTFKIRKVVNKLKTVEVPSVDKLLKELITFGEKKVIIKKPVAKPINELSEIDAAIAKLLKMRKEITDKKNVNNTDGWREKLSNVLENGGKLKFNDVGEKEKEDILNELFNAVKLSDKNKIVLKFESDNFKKRLPLNERNIKFLRELLLKGVLVNHERTSEIKNYNSEYIKELINFKNVEIQVFKNDDSKYQARTGAFFKYTVKEELYNPKWSRYGLFTEVKASNYKHNCLYRAFLNSDLELTKDELLALNNAFQTRNIPMVKLHEVALALDLHVSIDKDCKDGRKKRKYNFNKTAERKINLGLIDDHYFIIDKETDITHYALMNIEKVRGEKNYNRIIKVKKGRYERSNLERRTVDSYKLVELMLKNKNSFLNEITLNTKGLLNTQYYEDVEQKFECLEYNKKLQTRPVVKPYETLIEYQQLYKDILKSRNADNTINKESRKAIKELNKEVKPSIINYLFNTAENDKSQSRIVVFDFETESSDSGKHTPYLLCAEFYENGIITKKSYQRVNDTTIFIKDFMNDLEQNDIVYAHNLGYDWRILQSFCHGITVTGAIIQLGKKVMQVPIVYKKKKIVFKDSYAMISMALKNFGKSFNLDTEKEVMNYGIYTRDSLTEKEVSISDFISGIPYETEKERIANKKQFISNIDKWNLVKSNGMFDHIEYARKYCELDVTVTMQGLLTFRKWIKELCADLDIYEIDIKNVISISSLAKRIFLLRGDFEKTYELAGHAQQFIQKTVVGGRCMTRNNAKWHIKRKEGSNNAINDFDGVSLYPSAIARLPGYLKGTPKVIKEKKANLKFLSKCSQYYVEVDIKNIPKKLPFPLISKINESGVRDFSNEVRGLVYLDKIQLEDLMTHHEMKEGKDFNIIRGYYFNKGFNKGCVDTIKFLFNERLKKKQQKNPCQIIYKLLMNSSYGKLIQKPCKDSTVIKPSKKEAETYIIKNHNFIKEYSVVSEGTKWEKYIIKKVDPINKHYNQVHQGSYVLSMSKRIMNEVMCLANDINANIYYQDTDSMHIEDNKIKLLAKEFKKKYNRELIGKQLSQFHSDFDFESKDKLPVAVESIIIGKKMYFDKVECINNGEKSYHEHVRLKGIPTWAINQPYKKFMRLANNKICRFKISEQAEVKSKCLMTFNRDYSIQFNENMTRCIKKLGQTNIVEI